MVSVPKVVIDDRSVEPRARVWTYTKQRLLIRIAFDIHSMKANYTYLFHFFGTCVNMQVRAEAPAKRRALPKRWSLTGVERTTSSPKYLDLHQSGSSGVPSSSARHYEPSCQIQGGRRTCTKCTCLRGTSVTVELSFRPTWPVAEAVFIVAADLSTSSDT